MINRRKLILSSMVSTIINEEALGKNMTIVPYQSLTSIGGHAVDPQASLFYWGPFNGGDEGQEIGVYAYDGWAWQFTGYPTNPADNMHPPTNVPVMPDRKLIVRGTNDYVCWGTVFSLLADPAGMAARTGDPMHSGDGGWQVVKPVIEGSLNPAGPDCGLLLYCARKWPSRT